MINFDEVIINVKNLLKDDVIKDFATMTIVAGVNLILNYYLVKFQVKSFSPSEDIGWNSSRPFQL